MKKVVLLLLLAVACKHEPLAREAKMRIVVADTRSAVEAVSYAVAGDQVLLGMTDAVTLALDVRAGREPSLADRPELAKLAERLPADLGLQSAGYCLYQK